MRGIVCVVVIVVATTLCSCLAPQNALMVGVDMQSWSKTDTLYYDNSDTLSLRNLNIALRYNDNFKESVLPLRIGISAPNAQYFEETIYLQIEHSRNTLMVAKTESLPYRDSVVLRENGEYIFAFTPLDEVRGMEAIGIEFRDIAE